ncbi:MAG: ATP-grasp domain-containing protein [Actinobacteria bacterium]|nr:ATP-grasp domain-containing protein [Actinomycetota bacterium]
MPRAVVVLPSTTYRARDFVEAAEALGVDLVVASEQPPPFEMGEGYVQIDCSDPHRAAETIVALGDEVPLDGVVAADDAGVVVAALAGKALGVAANDPSAAAATRDKLEMRRRFAASEISQPEFAVIEPGSAIDDRGVGYPAVAKPLNRSAGQGVIRVDTPDHLSAAVGRIRSIIGDQQAPVLIESFLVGDELALEGLVRGGELAVLAVFDKPGRPTGPYFPETILVTPSRLPGPVQSEATRVAQRAVEAVGIEHGPVHIELMADEGKVRVIELAARSIGGLCSRSLNFGLMGTTLETLVLRNSLGLDKPELRRERAASGVLMIPIPRSGTLDAVDGIDRVREIEGITGTDLTIQPGSQVLSPPEGDRYLGFVFARGDTPDQVESLLTRANALIDVKVS